MLYTINQTKKNKNKNNKHKITKTIIHPPGYINIGLFLSTEIRQVDNKRLPVKKPCSKTGEPLYRKNGNCIITYIILEKSSILCTDIFTLSPLVNHKFRISGGLASL